MSNIFPPRRPRVRVIVISRDQTNAVCSQRAVYHHKQVGGTPVCQTNALRSQRAFYHHKQVGPTVASGEFLGYF